MARIRVTPEEVNQVATQFRNASQQSQEMVNRLQQTMNSLQPNWEGLAQQRFYGEYEQWRNSMTQFVQLLANIAQQLDQIAERFRQADQI